MTRPYRYVDVDRRGEVWCVRLRQSRLDEPSVYEATGELRHLVTEDGCRKMALSLGPESPECLYSVFLARLITLQRVLNENRGELVLCHVQAPVHDIFAACSLDHLFRFLADFDAAIAYWTP